MKKFLVFLVFAFYGGVNAQYGAINELLDRLEARRGVNQNLKDENISGITFVLIKELDDHTERNFLKVNDGVATYVEIFDDKATGQSSSNVFSGDAVRTKHNILSVRADKLEGEKIIMPLTKTFLLTKQKNILYLVDINTRERWVDERSFAKNK